MYNRIIISVTLMILTHVAYQLGNISVDTGIICISIDVLIMAPCFDKK